MEINNCSWCGIYFPGNVTIKNKQRRTRPASYREKLGKLLQNVDFWDGCKTRVKY